MRSRVEELSDLDWGSHLWLSVVIVNGISLWPVYIFTETLSLELFCIVPDHGMVKSPSWTLCYLNWDQQAMMNVNDVEWDHSHEAPWKQSLQLRQTPTRGYATLIPEVSGIFIFLLRVCGAILQPSYEGRRTGLQTGSTVRKYSKTSANLHMWVCMKCWFPKFQGFLFFASCLRSYCIPIVRPYI